MSKIYCCSNCNSEDVKQHVQINGHGMLKVNGNPKPTFPPLIDYNIVRRGYFECWDCGHRWTKIEKGEWIEEESK